MFTLMIAALAAQPVLPSIDRRSLDMLAAAEAKPRTVVSNVRPQPPARYSIRSGNLRTIGLICDAAGQQKDPDAFIQILAAAFKLRGSEGAKLQETCAIYLAGQASRPLLRRASQ